MLNQVSDVNGSCKESRIQVQPSKAELVDYVLSLMKEMKVLMERANCHAEVDLLTTLINKMHNHLC